jgi:hypothetical protein
MQELYRVWEFVWAIASNWIVLAGGAIMTVFGIIERLRGAEVHLKIYAKILVCLLVVSFYLSWRDAKMQSENNGSSSAPIKFDSADYEARQELAQTKRELASAHEAIASAERELNTTKEQLAEARRDANEAHNTLIRLAKIADAEREYHGVASLDLIGKPGPDGDIIFNTPISKSLEGAYVLHNNVPTYKKDQIGGAQISRDHTVRQSVSVQLYWFGDYFEGKTRWGLAEIYDQGRGHFGEDDLDSRTPSRPGSRPKDRRSRSG